MELLRQLHCDVGLVLGGRRASKARILTKGGSERDCMFCTLLADSWKVDSSRENMAAETSDML